MITIEELRVSSEQWRAVDGWPEYEVSDMGRVRRASDGRVRRLELDVEGYQRITFVRRPVFARQRVHRLVAAAFLGEPEDGRREVNHIDGNRSNNVAWNLEWVDLITNIHHSLHALGRRRKIEERRRKDGRFGPASADDNRVRDPVHPTDDSDSVFGEVPF